MEIEISADLDKKLEKLQRRDPKLFKRIDKQLSIFQKNKNHPSLRNHELKGELSGMFSISISMKIRMLYIRIDHDTYHFFDIGTHDEVYR